MIVDTGAARNLSIVRIGKGREKQNRILYTCRKKTLTWTAEQTSVKRTRVERHPTKEGAGTVVQALDVALRHTRKVIEEQGGELKYERKLVSVNTMGTDLEVQRMWYLYKVKVTVTKFLDAPERCIRGTEELHVEQMVSTYKDVRDLSIYLDTRILERWPWAIL